VTFTPAYGGITPQHIFGHFLHHILAHFDDQSGNKILSTCQCNNPLHHSQNNDNDNDIEGFGTPLVFPAGIDTILDAAGGND
jgi:hypothetical protein